ncbi:MAG: ABC transporter substrate-binding protein, partial [Anaerolineae bacterium]|nr:ABC transporter substrate-binding protein [Anaerolineae bacterium]
PTPPPAAPAKPTEAPKPAAKSLVLGMSKSDLKTLDPHRQYEIAAPRIIRAAYEGLVTLADKSTNVAKVEGLLAESWQVSPDGKEYTFKLRKGVKFNTGKEMTADDVKFSYERLGLINDNGSWLYSDHITKTEAVDAGTIKFTLIEPNAAFLSILASSNFSVIDSAAAKGKGATNAADAEKTDKAAEYFDGNGASLGTGPFIIKEWKRGDQVVMEKNANYWREAPAFDRLVIREIPDDTARLQALDKGDIDIALDLDIDQVTKLKKDGKYNIVEGVTLDTAYMGLTTNKEISKELADKKVRQAIQLAIDYDGIVKELLRDSVLQLPGAIPLTLLGTDGKLAVKRDVAKAKALLKEAGFEKGLELKLQYGTGYKLAGVLSAETLATKLQADLKEVGVNLKLEPRDQAAIRTDYRGGKLAMVIADWTPDFLDPHGWAPSFTGNRGAAKRLYYNTPETKKLADDAGVASDNAKRAEAYLNLTKLMIDDAVFVGLYQPKVFMVANKALQGVTYNPLFVTDFYYIKK